MSAQPKAVILTPGKCRVCGCTDLQPCSTGPDEACSWIDAQHTLCSYPFCVAKVPLEELMAMELAS